MSNETNVAVANDTNAKLPKWQKISGLTPEIEAKMSADDRDAAIRKLLREVERLAADEIARGEKTPADERTIYWEPLEKVCRELGISRTKLSSYSRELTGLRANEIADKLKAKDIYGRIFKRLQRVLAPKFEELLAASSPERIRNQYYKSYVTRELWIEAKNERRGVSRARWAVELGFANPSRLSRACLIAHGMSVEEIEWLAIAQLVQLFLKQLTQTPRQEKAEKPRVEKVTRETVLTDEEIAAAEQVVKEVCDEVARMSFAAA